MEIFANVTSTHKDTYTDPNKELHKTNHTQKTDNINKNDSSKEKEEQEQKTKITKEELQKLTEKLNKEISPLNPDIKFHFNDKVDEMVVNVIDKNTDKVIRKIPSDEALKIMEKMRELIGILFDKKG